MIWSSLQESSSNTKSKLKFPYIQSDGNKYRVSIHIQYPYPSSHTKSDISKMNWIHTADKKERNKPTLKENTKYIKDYCI